MDTKRGLNQRDAANRLTQYGYNEIRELLHVSPIKILFRQIKSNFVIFLLVFALLISFFVGKTITAYTILIVIFLVIFLGFTQEYRAEKSILALRQMIMPVSIVIRDGKEQDIPSRELVPRDLIILRNGEKIPADCIILEEKELMVNESILTGESKELKKFAVKSESKYNENNLIFMGSFIVNGRCIARVINTGMNTKFGNIARMISTAEKELPLQNKINRLSKYMAAIGISVSILTGLLMFFRSAFLTYDVIVNILILVVAVAVASFPEGFPLVLITTLALGANRMAKNNVIVNRMSIIETLGETTVICADKTGTITKGEMTVKKLFADGCLFDISGSGYEDKGEFFCDKNKISPQKESVLNLLLKASVLCNDSRIKRKGEDNEYNISGSTTEAALLILAAKARIFKEDFDFERIEEIPFNSERKMMSVLCKLDKKDYVFTKGAPEFLLKKCAYVQRNDGIFKLTTPELKRILSLNKNLTSNAFRTLVLAYKKVDSFSKDHFEEDLVFLGLVGMEDSPREEVKNSLDVCRKAGIKVKMITGDNRETALAIARQIGLPGGILEGYELDALNDSNLCKVVRSTAIFARVRPEHKLRIVRALKENGEIVTMTGDGVNDAPALKEAHIGVAMGKNGTDVSRSVADLTLKDDHFSTIVSAIREGRTIFNNIRKFVSYELSCNFAELFIIFIGVLLAPVFGWPVPLLLALQILFMNLITDNLPSFTLGFNPSSDDIMEEKPRKKSEILNHELFYLILFTGSFMGIFSLGVFFVIFNLLNQPAEIARTMSLVTLIFFEIAAAFSFRSFRKGVLNRSPFVNKYLFFASALCIIITLFVVYSPIRKIFETSPISLVYLLSAIGLSFFLVITFDILKKINLATHFWSKHI